MPNMKIIGTDKPNSHWCRPSDSRGGRPHPQRPHSLNKIQKEKFDPLYRCCVRKADKYSGVRFRLCRRWTATSFEKKRNFQVPKGIIYQTLQISHLMKPKPVLSPRFQTNLWSLNCTNVHTQPTLYISSTMEAKHPRGGWHFPWALFISHTIHLKNSGEFLFSPEKFAVN